MSFQVRALPGKVTTATPATKGFDCDTKLDTTQIKAFVAAGYDFVIRYLTLGNTQDTVNDLDFYEADAILEAGLGLMVVAHVRMPGWNPSATLGTTDGENAVANATYIGLPTGVNIWLDLEGVASGTTAQDVINYCNNWYSAVNNAGFVPGLYVGYDSILTSDQLYYDLAMSHYWKSLSSVPTPTNRGFQMIQTAGVTVAGVETDTDTIQKDSLGGLPIYLHI